MRVCSLQRTWLAFDLVHTAVVGSARPETLARDVKGVSRDACAKCTAGGYAGARARGSQRG